MGLSVPEGVSDSDSLAALESAALFEGSTQADLLLLALEVRGFDGVVRQAEDPAGVLLRPWPGEPCGVVTALDRGALVLRVRGKQVQATLSEVACRDVADNLAPMLSEAVAMDLFS